MQRAIAEGLVGGEGFAVDASLIAADANKQRSLASTDEVDWQELAATRRAVREYLATLDEAAWGAASEVVPKFISPSDPAAQWTGAHKGMVEEKNIAPHVPVWDKGERTDGTFSRSDFIFDAVSNTYTCPGGKILQQYRRPFTIPRTGVTKDKMRLYRARQSDCEACALKARCCPGQTAPQGAKERA